VKAIEWAMRYREMGGGMMELLQCHRELVQRCLGKEMWYMDE
jgi:hypothetical protein